MIEKLKLSAIQAMSVETVAKSLAGLAKETEAKAGNGGRLIYRACSLFVPDKSKNEKDGFSGFCARYALPYTTFKNYTNHAQIYARFVCPPSAQWQTMTEGEYDSLSIPDCAVFMAAIKEKKLPAEIIAAFRKDGIAGVSAMIPAKGEAEPKTFAEKMQTFAAKVAKDITGETDAGELAKAAAHLRTALKAIMEREKAIAESAKTEVEKAA